MEAPANINSAIIDTLYSEALDLAAEAQTLFSIAQHLDADSVMGVGMEDDNSADAAGDAALHTGLPSKMAGGAADPALAQLALSSEALRTRTHITYALAWLLNQRAFLAGTLSIKQLRRQAHLPPAQVEEDPKHLSLLPPQLRDIILITQRFYKRLERLESLWNRKPAVPNRTANGEPGRLGLVFAGQ